jgi:hypothetical protein
MTRPLDYGDAEGAVRAWARLVSATGGRVFFAPPARGRQYPLTTVQRVGGAPNRGDLPVDEALIEFDVLGEKATDKASTAAVAYALVSAIQSVACGTPMGDLVCGSATVESGPTWMPEPDTGRARYTFDGRFSLRRRAA